MRQESKLEEQLTVKSEWSLGAKFWHVLNGEHMYTEDGLNITLKPKVKIMWVRQTLAFLTNLFEYHFFSKILFVNNSDRKSVV